MNTSVTTVTPPTPVSSVVTTPKPIVVAPFKFLSYYQKVVVSERHNDLKTANRAIWYAFKTDFNRNKIVFEKRIVQSKEHDLLKLVKLDKALMKYNLTHNDRQQILDRTRKEILSHYSTELIF